MKSFVYSSLVIVVITLALFNLSSSLSFSTIKKCLKECKSSGVKPRDCFKVHCAGLLSVYKKQESQSDSEWWWGTPDAPEEVKISENKPEPKPANPVTDNLIWASYRDQLFSFFKKGGSTKGLQLLRNPIVASWDSNPSELSGMCNVIPQWGAEFKYDNKVSFSEQYHNFLKNIKVQDGSSLEVESMRQQLAGLKKQLEDLSSGNNDEEQKCLDRYKRLYGRTENPSVTYEQFKASRCRMSSSFNDYQIAILKSDIFRLEEQIRAAGSTDVKDALDKISKSTSFEWNEVSSSLQSFKNAIDNDRMDPFQVTVAKTALSQSEFSTNQEWNWKEVDQNKQGKTEEFIKVDGEAKSFSFTTSKDDFRMTITAESHTGISVKPSNSWFDSNILSKYADGSKFKKNINFFGKTGKLPLQINTVYVLYKPSVTLKLSQRDANQIKGFLRNGKTMIIGPFEINEESVQAYPSKDNPDLFDVVFSGAEEPLVVATDNTFLP